MKCPSCNSADVVRSQRKGLERHLRFFSLRDPYRCKDCWTRFRKFRPPFQSALSKVLLTVFILLCLAVYLAPEIRERFFPVTPETPVSVKAPPVKKPARPEPAPEKETAPAGQTPAPAESPRISIADMKVKEASPPLETATSKKTAADADPPPGPRTLSDISFENSPEAFRVILSAGAPITRYDAFYEENPLRLILDLKGAWAFPGGPVLQANGRIMKRLRIGEHPDRLRIVLDLKGGAHWGHEFAASPEGLILILRKKAAGEAAE